MTETKTMEMKVAEKRADFLDAMARANEMRVVLVLDERHTGKNIYRIYPLNDEECDCKPLFTSSPVENNLHKAVANTIGYIESKAVERKIPELVELAAYSNTTLKLENEHKRIWANHGADREWFSITYTGTLALERYLDELACRSMLATFWFYIEDCVTLAKDSFTAGYLEGVRPVCKTLPYTLKNADKILTRIIPELYKSPIYRPSKDA